MKNFVQLLLIFCWAGFVYAQTDLEQKLAEDIQDYRLDDFTRVEAAFILSGANEPDSLQKYVDWYNQLLGTLQNFYLDAFDPAGSAAKVFDYLHTTWLLTYKERATTLIDVVNEKRFNCVAGTILYNFLCLDLGFDTEAFETPTHTYTIFPNFDRKIIVENTNIIGFDIMKNLREKSRLMLNFYPEKEALRIGLDRIYAYENSKGRAIDNTELLGLLAYNRAYFANEEKDYEKAYQYVMLAQNFNKDSRSNVQFEINLYYRWGQQLYEQQDYNQAFTVFADAYYRYWENKDFAQNCNAAFFYAHRQNWQKKGWPQARQMTWEMYDLQILDDQGKTNLTNVLHNWIVWLIQQKRENDIHDAKELLKQVYPDSPYLQ